MQTDYEEKNTDNLQTELADAPSLDVFLEQNEANFNTQNVPDLLNAMFLKANLTKAELARRSGVSTVYLHQLFAGKRSPSRDRLICLSIGLAAPVEETQALLRRSGFAELYAKDRRDAIILYGITRSLSLDEVNDLLFSKGENTLI